MPGRSELLDSFHASPPAAQPHWNDEAFWTAARAEGMLPLLADRLASCGWPGVSEGMRRKLAQEIADEAARAALMAADVRRVLQRLSEDGVRPLLVKGAALARTHYEAPHLRPSVDVDLLVSEQDVEPARRSFERMGAEWIPHVSGDLIMPQFHYVTTGAGYRQTYDVHYRALNPLAFAGVLPWSLAVEEAVDVPGLGPHARTIASHMALILACAHKAAHHRSDRLIWLLDIHLLAERLSPAAGEELRRLAREWRVSVLTRKGLLDAHAAFRGERARDLAGPLGPDGASGEEHTAKFLGGAPTGARGVVGELRVLRTGRRITFIRELLFPDRRYMRRRYAHRRRTPLAILYLERVVLGCVGWLRRR